MKALLVFLLNLGLALGVCAAGQNESRRFLETDTAAVWLDVPFVPQQARGCGAASVAMVMQYWHREVHSPAPVPHPENIRRELSSPAMAGVSGKALARFLEAAGFQTFTFRGSWEDLHSHLQKGRPLIVCLAPRQADAPFHYVVVAGLDSRERILLVNDPAQRKLTKVGRQEFESRWQAVDFWTLLAVPR